MSCSSSKQSEQSEQSEQSKQREQREQQKQREQREQREQQSEQQPIKFMKQDTNYLDVYYICDRKLDYDFSGSFKRFIKNHNYKLMNITQLNCENTDETNILKRGIHNFKKYFTSLKLKSTNTLWFVYIGKEKQMDIIMIVENPKYGKNEFIYHISKNNKKFSNYMLELFKTNKRLKFDMFIR
jgi:hypothetical protein